jgi:hypothetical protein
MINENPNLLPLSKMGISSTFYKKIKTMKKSIQLFLPFILFLCIANTSTAQNDATFEEAIDFVVNDIEKNRNIFEVNLKYVSEYELEYTLHSFKNKEGFTHEANFVSKWSMSDITEVEIVKSEADGIHLELKCFSGEHSGKCVVKTYTFISGIDTIYEGKHHKEEDPPRVTVENMNYVTFDVRDEETAQRVKKALDHARKLAGAKEEKF